MVVDSSAILAVLLREPERDAFATAIADAGTRLVSSVNALEAAIVVAARKGPSGLRELDLFFHRAGIEVVSFTAAHLGLAREAWERYGKGRHPAGLNLGDCCAYALARHSGEPLLFKGGDFGRTDVPRAV
jgi:ribonuclease VapC